MQRLHIEQKPNKAAAALEIKRGILSVCDEDIAAAFEPHGFTIEPLLIQLIREVRWLNEYYGNASPSDLRTSGDATADDHATHDRKPGPEETIANDVGGGEQP